MRMNKVLFLLAFVPSIAFAGGEYDHWHFGPRLGIGWSPNGTYGVQQDPATGIKYDGSRRFSGSLGLEGRYDFVPGCSRIGISADYIRTLNEGANKDVDMTQEIIRGTVRWIYSPGANTMPGSYFFVGPTWNSIRTSGPVIFETGHVIGGTLGFGSHTHYETHSTYWEVGAHYLPETKDKTKAGGATLEFRYGWAF